MKASSKSPDQKHADGRQDRVVDPASTTGDRGSTTANRNGGGSVLKRLSSACADFYFPCRYVVVFLLFLGMCFAHAQRVNVGVTVVSIVDSRHQIVSVDVSHSPDNSSVIVTSDDSVRLPACCCGL